jgi:thiamine pyrophosphate-dependent acetolactate synthase large subunit-like protein
MKTREAMRVLAAHRGDAVAVCALGMASNEWWQATKSEETFYMHGAMGFAASFALGFALTAPDVPVLLLNADGSLCMNLGCLLTEAQQAPPNLKHFLIDNRVYQTVSAVPMVNRDLTDYAGIARAAGISRTLTIDNVADLEKAVPEIMASPGRAHLSRSGAERLRRSRNEIPLRPRHGAPPRRDDLRPGGVLSCTSRFPYLALASKIPAAHA